MQRLSQKIALVTGAASGIGKATAERFAREGARVLCADINATGAAETAQMLTEQTRTQNGYSAESIVFDVTSEERWNSVTNEILQRCGRLDIVVNNAGISFGKSLADMTLDEWRRVMAVNLDSVMLGTKYAMLAMRTTGVGSIINVSSASGIKPVPGASAYCTSKAAVQMLSQTAALECAQAGHHIRVNCVVPSGVMTPMWQQMDFWHDLVAQTGSEEAAWQTLSADIPLKRNAYPEEIAAAIAYLASDESSFVTGSSLVIDGGYTL